MWSCAHSYTSHIIGYPLPTILGCDDHALRSLLRRPDTLSPMLSGILVETGANHLKAYPRLRHLSLHGNRNYFIHERNSLVDNPLSTEVQPRWKYSYGRTKFAMLDINSILIAGFPISWSYLSTSCMTSMVRRLVSYKTILNLSKAKIEHAQPQQTLSPRNPTFS